MKHKKTAKQRLWRLADFARRRRNDPGNVFSCWRRDWDFIPVHPMANEVDVLARLQLQPEDCVRVDCYWRVRRDVVFLEVYSTKAGRGGAPGLYARRHEDGMLYCTAVVEEPVISQPVIEAVMTQYQWLIANENLLANPKIGRDCVQIAGG